MWFAVDTFSFHFVAILHTLRHLLIERWYFQKQDSILQMIQINFCLCNFDKFIEQTYEKLTNFNLSFEFFCCLLLKLLVCDAVVTKMTELLLSLSNVPNTWQQFCVIHVDNETCMNMYTYTARCHISKNKFRVTWMPQPHNNTWACAVVIKSVRWKCVCAFQIRFTFDVLFIVFPFVQINKRDFCLSIFECVCLFRCKLKLSFLEIIILAHHYWYNTIINHTMTILCSVSEQ